MRINCSRQRRVPGMRRVAAVSNGVCDPQMCAEIKTLSADPRALLGMGQHLTAGNDHGPVEPRVGLQVSLLCLFVQLDARLDVAQAAVQADPAGVEPDNSLAAESFVLLVQAPGPCGVRAVLRDALCAGNRQRLAPLARAAARVQWWPNITRLEASLPGGSRRTLISTAMSLSICPLETTGASAGALRLAACRRAPSACSRSEDAAAG